MLNSIYRFGNKNCLQLNFFKANNNEFFLVPEDCQHYLLITAAGTFSLPECIGISAPYTLFHFLVGSAKSTFSTNVNIFCV